MLSPRTLARLTSISVFLNTAPGMRGGQPAEERLTAGTQLPALVPELQEGDVRLRVAAAAKDRAHDLRRRLTDVWALAGADDIAGALDAVNALLAETGPLRLAAVDDGVDLAPAQLPADAVERLTAMAALALAEAAVEGELSRLHVCAGEDCENTLVDGSRNRSKRFCDAANCANRTHVRSYRARLAETEEAEAEAAELPVVTAEQTAEPGPAGADGPAVGKKAKKDKKAKKKDGRSGKADKKRKKEKKGRRHDG